MEMIGTKPGTKFIFFRKRGKNFLPLFNLLYALLFQGTALAQLLSPGLFSTPSHPIIENVQKPSYSINTLYNHTFKQSVNDTVITHIYKSKTYQQLTLPFKYSTLSLGHSYNDAYAGFRDYISNQHIYNEQKFNDLTFVYQLRPFHWLNLNLSYGNRLDNYAKDLSFGFKLQYKGFLISSENASQSKKIISYFDTENTDYVINNYKGYKQSSFETGFIGEKLLFSIKRQSRLSSPNEELNEIGVGLFIATSRLQYDIKLSYQMNENIRFWNTTFYQRDTAEVPIFWEDDKIGEFTAIDDTLFSRQIGVSFYKHSIAYGSGSWRGDIWISQLSPDPFLSAWANLAGTRYYLDFGTKIKFNGLLYSYNYSVKNWDNSIGINLLDFKGLIDFEHWAWSFFVGTPLNDKFNVDINNLRILESSFNFSTNVTKTTQLKFWMNLLLPIDADISFDPEQDIDIDADEDQDVSISGGLQAGLSINYLFDTNIWQMFFKE